MPRFPPLMYDVTNYGESCILIPCCGWITKTLVMDEEEVSLRFNGCCLNNVQQRPYAQLNTVDVRTQCWGMCTTLSSDLAKVDVEGKGGISPGCGCATAQVQEIADQLNLRKNGRGNIAQIRQQTYMVDHVNKLKLQIPALLDHFGVAYPPDADTIKRIWGNKPPKEFRALRDVLGMEGHLEEFETREYDVTCCIEPLCCTNKKLILGPEEVVMKIVSGITRNTVTEHRPYANIDQVQAGKACVCMSALQVLERGAMPGSSAMESITPGTGCNAGLVEGIRADLQARVGARGQVGQVQQLEKMQRNMSDLVAEMPLILDKLGLESAYPPSQQTMSNLYGAGAPQQPPVAPLHEVTSQTFPEKTYDVQNTCSNWCGLLFTCGFSKATMTLTEEEVVTVTSNNCMNQENRTAYGQLGSVDYCICCCFHSVNGFMPGCGRDQDKIRNISEELQNRKVQRGNIAQIRNQENTMHNSIELDVRTDILRQHLVVAFPPTQETMVSMYGATPPVLPHDEANRGSGIHLAASERVEARSWTTTHYVPFVCCCGQTSNLELDDEEFIVNCQGPLFTTKVRTPYAQMGMVNTIESCLCCKVVSTDHVSISPGCGCDSERVKEISDELQRRKVIRGNIAQIRQQENLIIELIKLGVKLDLIAREAKIQNPPSQETMDRLFGQGAQAPAPAGSFSNRSVSPRASSVTIEVTVPDGLSRGDEFTVKGPRGSFKATVPAGAVPGQKIQVLVPMQSGGSTPLLQGTEMSARTITKSTSQE